MPQSAFILRILPKDTDMVPLALQADQIIIGWANAEGLLDDSLSWGEFRKIIQEAYYANETNLRRAGAAAGHMWRFIREMKHGDLVVVPYGATFYVAEISGPAVYLPVHKTEDAAYRRQVAWLNGKKPLGRNLARSPLLSRMKIQGTSADAVDLLDEIKECLRLASSNEKPTFQNDLQRRLIQAVVEEMRGGRIENFGFEKLIKTVLEGLGANTCTIIPRKDDKGADLIAKFRIAGAFELRVAVQAKHWQPKPPVGRNVVEQLIQGIEAESANLGMVVTCGSISPDAITAAQEYYEKNGIQIELIDGEQLAKLIVEHGISTN